MNLKEIHFVIFDWTDISKYIYIYIYMDVCMIMNLIASYKDWNFLANQTIISFYK
jgi:hypothetical protein